MTKRRNKCVMMGAAASQAKVMPHSEFIDRIRKTLYYGADTLDDEMEVSRPLANYASEMFSEPHKKHSLNGLHRVAAGSVHATPCSLIMALIYLDRLNVIDPGYARCITPQEMFIVSMMISTKFYAGYDEEVFLSDWAEDGDIPEDRLKQLELEFLSSIEWNIYISNEEFFKKLATVEKSLAKHEGLSRGWLTYTELMQMLPAFTLAKFILNSIAVMAVGYVAGIVTIAGAFWLASQMPGHALSRNPTTDKTVGNVSSSLVVEDAVLPSPQDLLQETEAQVAANATHLNNGTSTTTILIAPNATCAALNVEAELLKLEQQYRDHVTREALRRHQHEISSATRLTLPANVLDLDAKFFVERQQDVQSNWLAFKGEYSDGIHLNEPPHHFNDKDCPFYGDGYELLRLSECFSNFGNCTSTSMFWQLLADTAQQSLVRSTLNWIKFI